MPILPPTSRPDLSDVFRHAADLSHDELLTLLTADMHRRWGQHLPVPVESYLALSPALRGNPELVLDLIATEAMLAEQAGRAADPAEYSRRFPDLAAGIERRFALMATL